MYDLRRMVKIIPSIHRNADGNYRLIQTHLQWMASQKGWEAKEHAKV
jgi:hypothetical protein